jgi:hypothetical protein
MWHDKVIVELLRDLRKIPFIRGPEIPSPEIHKDRSALTARMRTKAIFAVLALSIGLPGNSSQVTGHRSQVKTGKKVCGLIRCFKPATCDL